MLMFTGGVDGTIVGWKFETLFASYEMHKWDPTCCCEDFVA